MADPRTRIFVVDDHALVREWLAAVLRAEPGFELAGQADAAPVALAAIAGRHIDVAIVDLSLRTGSGLDLIKAVRKASPATQVIVLSMHEELHYVERAFRAGARAYVMKRDPTDAILTAIRQVRAGGVYARPDILAQLTDRLITAPAHDPAEILSDRELEVFRRLGEGQQTRRIATEMHLSMKTVQAYAARIKEKLGLANVNELMREAVRWSGRPRSSPPTDV